MYRVIIAQPIAEEGVQLLERQGYNVKKLERYSPEALLESIDDADGLLVRDAKVTREVIERGRKLKVISRHGAGLDQIDLAAATERRIVVTYAPIANSLSVAEHVLGMMLVLAKHMFRVDRGLRAGDFEIRHRLYGMELAGKTLSVVGLGNIGRRLGTMACRGMGMHVLGFDPYVRQADVDPDIEVTGEWERMFREGDFISLHTPLTPETRGCVAKREFGWMKPTAYLINCARSPLVDEEALIQALKEDRIAGAGIDVYLSDPPPSDHPLLSMENVVVTPHSAAHTHEAMVNMATHAAQGIIEVLEGKTPTWVANPSVQ
jgi:D-3-phosphoglycerate dehydrogenase / 2-oxoglutarate reductase